LDLYQFKDIIAVPVSFNYHYYQYNFSDDGNLKTRYILSTSSFKIGIYAKTLKKINFVIFGNMGMSYMSFKKSFVDNKEREYKYKSIALRPNFEFGLKYILYSK
jgi:hypothetical protein